jgi:hypothetical protein
MKKQSADRTSYAISTKESRKMGKLKPSKKNKGKSKRKSKGK